MHKVVPVRNKAEKMAYVTQAAACYFQKRLIGDRESVTRTRHEPR